MENTEVNIARTSLRDILFIVFLKIHVLAGTVIVAVVGTFMFTFLVSPIYEVTANVFVKPFVDTTLKLETLTNFRVWPVTREDINAEINIMTSDELLRRVVKELALDKPRENKSIVSKAIYMVQSAFREILIWIKISVRTDPTEAQVKQLKKQLEIKPVTLSNMIRVTLTGKDPARITKIVNTFLNQHLDYHIEVLKPKGGVAFYSRQAGIALRKLEKGEKALKSFQKKWSIIEIKSQRSANLELIRTLRKTLSMIYGKIAESRSKIYQTEKEMNRSAGLPAMVEELRDNVLVIELTKAMVPMLVEFERISLLYPESSVEYRDSLEQLDRFKQEIKNEQSRILRGIMYDTNALSSQRKALAAEINRIEKESRFLSEKEIEWRALNREVNQNKKNYILYMDQTEEARISNQKDASRVSNIYVVSWANQPSAPVFPQKVRMWIISVFMGIFAGIGAAFAAYYLDHTVKRPEDLFRNCQVPVLASLAKIEPQE